MDDYLEIRYLKTGPVPWTVLADQLACEVFARRRSAQQRFARGWIELGYIARALQFLSAETATVPERLPLIQGSDGYILTPEVGVYRTDERRILAVVRGPTWLIRWPGESGQLGPPLRVILEEEVRWLAATGFSAGERLRELEEFLRDLPGGYPVEVMVRAPTMHLDLSPGDFAEAMLRTVRGVFGQDRLARGKEGAEPAMMLLTGREAQIRNHHRDRLQSAFDQFTRRFGLGRLELSE